jgi:hypothetical protein
MSEPAEPLSLGGVGDLKEGRCRGLISILIQGGGIDVKLPDNRRALFSHHASGELFNKLVSGH